MIGKIFRNKNLNNNILDRDGEFDIKLFFWILLHHFFFISKSKKSYWSKKITEKKFLFFEFDKYINENIVFLKKIQIFDTNNLDC